MKMKIDRETLKRKIMEDEKSGIQEIEAGIMHPEAPKSTMKIVIREDSSYTDDEIKNIDTEREFEPLDLLSYLATFPAVIVKVDYDNKIVIIDHPYAY